MKTSLVLALFVTLCASIALAAPIGTVARTVIPSEVQQIISVDYRELANSPVATELHDRVLPTDLKNFETALKGIGIVPQRDIDHLTFVSFRDQNQLRFVGVAEGQFALKPIFAKLKAKKIKPTKYHDASLFPMGNGLEMSLLDDNTMLFGNHSSMISALNARDGDAPALNSNSQIVDMMPNVDSSPVWSVLDGIGTQTMLRSALGDASKLADYDTVKKRLVGSRYAMEFNQGVNFDLDVITSDSMTASALSSLVEAGMMYKKMQASGQEKALFDGMSVDSDSDQLRVHFRSDDQKFQALLNSDLFAAVSR
jgi:hypothetical protein